ncbi:MAG: adenylate/guanylate cyclase domain-containing protein, partial [Candidatus Entotheonellia bacterium]
MKPDGGSVLIVDDAEINRDLLSWQLQIQGLTTSVAYNGRHALELIRELPFDLMLLDMMMPEMNGYQVLEHLKADPTPRYLPVVVISGVDDLESVVRCIELGAEDYLLKPFNSVLLKARVDACLEKKRLRDREQAYVQALKAEQEKSERLLLNVLPKPIADRLKQAESAIADSFAEVTVLFADIVDFSEYSAGTPPVKLLGLLNEIFSTFDQLAERYGLEKIKTIGDAYMVVGGLPIARSDHAEAVAEMALDMLKTIGRFIAANGKPFSLRIGINTGPVVAGVIGTKKFSYDLWGDTVNTASRMESHGLANSIQVTAETYERLRRHYLFEERGLVQVKGKG